jgi:hypothetical protein
MDIHRILLARTVPRSQGKVKCSAATVRHNPGLRVPLVLSIAAAAL